jgi:hypothetical protein
MPVKQVNPDIEAAKHLSGNGLGVFWLMLISNIANR